MSASPLISHNRRLGNCFGVFDTFLLLSGTVNNMISVGCMRAWSHTLCFPYHSWPCVPAEGFSSVTSSIMDWNFGKPSLLTSIQLSWVLKTNLCFLIYYEDCGRIYFSWSSLHLTDDVLCALALSFKRSLVTSYGSHFLEFQFAWT